MLAQVAQSANAGAADNVLTVAIVAVTGMGVLVAMLLKRWYGYG